MSFYKEVPGRQTTLESTLKFDTTPTAGSTNPVTSGAVKEVEEKADAAAEALQEQIDDIAEKAGSGYIPKGEASVATLNALSGQENGELYTMTDAGTLTDGSLAVVAGDTVAWDAANSVWYKAMDYAPRRYGTNEVHNLPTTITAFRTGDVIPVDGPSGTAKMSKDSLLATTAQNTANSGLVATTQELEETNDAIGLYEKSYEFSNTQYQTTHIVCNMKAGVTYKLYSDGTGSYNVYKDSDTLHSLAVAIIRPATPMVEYTPASDISELWVVNYSSTITNYALTIERKTTEIERIGNQTESNTTALGVVSSSLTSLEKSFDKRINVLIPLSSNAYSKSAALALKDFRITITDGTDEDTFWNGTHTYDGVDYKRAFCLAFYSNDNKIAHFYWFDGSAGFILNDVAFIIEKPISEQVKDGLYYSSKNVTLDGVACKVEMLFDWDNVTFSSSPFIGNKLDNSIIKRDHAGYIFDRKSGLYEKIAAAAYTVLPNFSSLSMGVDGDSITVGTQWSYYACQILGINERNNVALGSATWAFRSLTKNGVTYTPQNYTDPDFAGFSDGWESTDDPVELQKRANNCAKCHVEKFIAEVTAGTYSVPDIFCFSFGTNDTTPTDEQVTNAMKVNFPATDDEYYNLAGGMRYAIGLIRNAYPNCKIFVLTPIQRAGSLVGVNLDMINRIEAIKKMASVFSAPIIDMFNCCGIAGTFEKNDGTGRYLADGLHPRVSGQKVMGAYAAEQIIALYGRHIS